MKFLPLLIAATLAIPAMAQQTKILTADKHNEYGLVYSLPITALEIKVTAKREVLTAGPYAQYARKYIGTDKVITRDDESWTITSVEVSPYGVIDSETKYLMQLKSGALTYIGVSEDGMLLSVNAQPKQRKLPMTAMRTQPTLTYSGKEYLKYVDDDFLASQSSAKQAQMLAESLMEVRDAYISLTRGTADNMPTDGRQLELMLNSIHAQEEALTAAFTGTRTEETVSRTYTYIPEDEGSEILFRFADFKGFVEKDDFSGAPVNISVAITSEGEIPADANGVAKQLPKDAIRYCIPGAAKISLSLNGKNLFSSEYEFSQYGVEFGLNPSLFTDKKEPSYAIFSDVTGGLLEIGTMSSANPTSVE